MSTCDSMPTVSYLLLELQIQAALMQARLSNAEPAQIEYFSVRYEANHTCISVQWHDDGSTVKAEIWKPIRRPAT